MFGFEKHCPVCGIDVEKEIGIRRYGKYFCSDDHAEVYSKDKMEKELSSDEESNRRGGGGCC
ncbi:MAG: hypothetical protein ACRD5J_11085 [Nitrososphaeraceae archaeon]